MTESRHHLVEEVCIEDFLLREGARERESSECVANLSVTKQHQRSATALTPKLLNIFSLSAITSHFFPPRADSLISRLQERGQKYNIINLLPEPAA